MQEPQRWHSPPSIILPKLRSARGVVVFWSVSHRSGVTIGPEALSGRSAGASGRIARDAGRLVDTDSLLVDMRVLPYIFGYDRRAE